MSDLAKVGELYTPLRTAIALLQERQHYRELREDIAEYFAGYPAPESLREPSAVYAPALVTPNLELRYMMDVATALPIPVRYMEFSKDKFVHLNYSKRNLGELVFFTAEHGVRQITEKRKIVDFQKAQGVPMNEISTLSGENFVEFHHRILLSAFQESTPVVEDFSDWFKKAATFDTSLPYKRYLGLFLTNSILFANFSTEKREVSFTEQRVLPAFRALRARFGVNPLIVPVQPTESDDEDFWCYYPDDVRKYC